MSDDTQQRIKDTVDANSVVLFMKGSPLFPQCGFSSRAVAILNHLGADFESVDVLQDQAVRQGIKSFSDWPTIPQLYVQGEFVGGSDIMMEMYESGELAELLKAKGLVS
ncbi:Grx4 family monothiol glutaredoxin [Stakelama tenebrarum]|uniref:Glutaredoxin n=1 Tax=Stakelama tenebrarum TaxID=2711215 RepID=A0A6G6Y9E8_9SPHN|nr:Grx4 family monothiol glutaredoxin [Sphingosinithalassobacter tenebrarum]QIG81196.1 Grx4 family monothiol glutaredoxin [Sphingosinithalassobacter tenebrarum]